MAVMENILPELPRIREAAAAMREVVLANLVMLGEAPAPTSQESRRISLLVERFSEFGLQHAAIDDLGNGLGVLYGTEGKRTILLTANADTMFPLESVPVIQMHSDEVIGPFVGDNSPALAALLSLPALLERLQIRLKSNLILSGTARMLHTSNLEGLRYLLDRAPMPIQSGLVVEGVQLGRLNYSCLGLLMADLTTKVPDDYDWSQFGATGSIIPMTDVINRINRIPLPRRPQTSIILGKLFGGFTYRNIARQTTLSFEVRSESAEILDQLAAQLDDITNEVAANSGVHVRLNIFARRQPGGLDIAHPLVRQVRAVHSAMGIQSMLYPTTSALACFADRKIPAVTLGFTTGQRRGELEEAYEAVSIPAMWNGLTQLAGVLLAMDEGVSNEK
ncbi:MAG: peptidase [Kiritimatiellae bacterium]|nr:peptidase [Kiritimatiellia bacterium]